MTKKIAFFDTKPYDKKSFDVSNQQFGFDITYFDAHLNERTAKLTAGFDAVCAFVNDSIGAQVITQIKNNGVELLAMRCAGYNNVDLKSAYGAVHVVRVPAYSPYAVAEHAVALMMTLNRKTHKAYNRTREGNFSINGFLGRDMHGKTAGVIGTGKIGRCLVSILKGFGMRVLLYDAYPDQKYAEEAGVEYVSLDTMYQQAHVISLHCPLTPETEHMINKESIKKMRDGMAIVNTSRGKLIDTTALIEGLKSGKIRGCGLDVYEEESGYFFEDKSAEVITDDELMRLMTFPNVLVTSHQAFFTAEAMDSIAEATLGNIKEFFDGGYLANEVCSKCGEQGCGKKDKKRCF